MSNRTLYFIIALSVVVWYYLKKVQTAQALTVRYKMPQSIRIENGAVYWNQPIVLTNPTATPINLQRYNMQVQIENYPIGTAYGTEFVKILAGRETTILAKVVIPVTNLISVIPDLLNAGKSLDIRFVGAITAEFITVPVDTKINIPIPKLFK